LNLFETSVITLYLSGYDGAYSPQNSVTGSGQTFLHGYLIMHIRAAKNIPDMENWYSKIYDKKDVTDPFVDVKLGKARIAKTAVIDNNLNPEWNETFRVEVCHKADTLVFDVRDKDHAYTEEIGLVEISTQHLINGQVIDNWFPIKKGNKVSKGELQFDTVLIYIIDSHLKDAVDEISDSVVNFLKHGSIAVQVLGSDFFLLPL